MNPRNFLLAAAAALLSTSTFAVDLRPGGAFVMGGIADHSGYSLTGGVVWPWAWKKEVGGGEINALTEGHIAHWSAKDAFGARHSYAHIALVPIFRYRFGQSRLWFVEGGIGISTTNRLYANSGRQFSTRFNFVDTAGIGRSFGAQREHELSLRITHVSNASIKRPNPGEEFLQLRYAKNF
ncbi:MAG TPA: acyloxyacyl hydrolase [Ramlibacter sp.]|nr:acyloxyacyl hydrolase [Ramlibacter sp.]